MKTMKRTLGVIMGFMLMMTLIPMSVFAAGGVPSTYSGSTNQIVGQIDLSGVTHNEGSEVQKDGKLYYEGTISGTVEASDLFEGAYNKYIADIKGQTTGGKQWDHLVMFDKGQNFPTARYTVHFPKDFVVNVNAINATENTAMISKISKQFNEADNSVTFTFNLGNWNDYEEFFKLYEGEKGTTGHPISISIPYSVEIKDAGASTLGTISADGKCELFYKKWFFETKIVDVTATKIDFNVSR
ncbi:hypothetical protein DXC94_03010 [Streptococcus anginosus]|nr:hypothetical protein DXC94_03010 [Streptococcus anginosus]